MDIIRSGGALRRVLLAAAVALTVASCNDGDPASTVPASSSATPGEPTPTGPAATSAPATSAPTTPAPTSSVVAAAPPTSVADEPDVATPGAEWSHVDPAQAGVDPAGLDTLAAAAEAAGSACTVVTRDGRVVDERYWDGSAPDTTHPAYSITKSVTALLVGIAEGDGALAVTDPMTAYVPEWTGTPSEGVTVENILSNDSGRHWDAATDYRGMAIRAEDKTAFSIALGQDAAPGDTWAYNNAAVQTLSRVLTTATGQDPAAYAQQRLFDPLGMAHTTMGHDPAGNATTFAGVQTTCLDLARLGTLALRGGDWNGTQIVGADFVHIATRQPSQELNRAYGWLWWLNQPGPIASPLVATTGRGAAGTVQGPLAPNAPDDTFWALGFQDQIVTVIPSEGIVAVRMGAEPPRDSGFDQTTFTDGVLAALTDRRGD